MLLHDEPPTTQDFVNDEFRLQLEAAQQITKNSMRHGIWNTNKTESFMRPGKQEKLKINNKKHLLNFDYSENF